jgi:hypothetical protein
MPRQSTLRDEIELIQSELRAFLPGSDGSFRRSINDITRFLRRLELEGVTRLRDITEQHALDFIEAPSFKRGAWIEPAASTMSARRTAIRVVLRVARRLHIIEDKFDPTVDIEIQGRIKRLRRPLTDEEELLGRLVAHGMLGRTRRPAAWALGQASAVTGELAAAIAGDLDLRGGRVWLHGTDNRIPRWGVLTTWGIAKLTEHVERFGDAASTPLIHGQNASVRSAKTLSTNAVREVLVGAGLNDDDIAPISLPNWAGRRVFDTTGRIEEAAKTLGLRSLDTTAQAIGWKWR